VPVHENARTRWNKVVVSAHQPRMKIHTSTFVLHPQRYTTLRELLGHALSPSGERSVPQKSIVDHLNRPHGIVIVRLMVYKQKKNHISSSSIRLVNADNVFESPFSVPILVECPVIVSSRSVALNQVPNVYRSNSTRSLTPPSKELNSQTTVSGCHLPRTTTQMH
jgi:hypothetical protein